MRSYAGLFLLSAATLFFEILLTRLFAVAQFYHFAFMIVSIALLGFGASGSVLAVIPRLSHGPARLLLSWCCLGAAVAMQGSLLLVNWLPFDSFSMAWDRRQVVVLVFHFLVLATPFFFCGLAVGSLLTARPEAAYKTYAANLGGSALGCLSALLAPAAIGAEGSVVFCALVASLAALATLPRSDDFPGPDRTSPRRPVGRLAIRGLPGGSQGAAIVLMAAALLTAGSLEVAARLQGKRLFPGLELRISPYKGLSYALQLPQAEVIYQRWSSAARLDVVRSTGIRSFPGLSFNYTGVLPAQDGLYFDGDDLSPVIQPTADSSFSSWLPASLALQLRPGGSVLVLEPRGGLDVLTSIAAGARSVTAVEPDRRVFEAAGGLYELPQVRRIASSGRSFVNSSQQSFDILVLSLVSSFHPVRSGAYSLTEDYRYTVEAYEDYLERLNPGGMLVFTRWTQSPPSESLRAFATAVTALEKRSGDPLSQIAAFRSYNTITFLVKNQPFTADEVSGIRKLTQDLSYDLVYLPGLALEETNRFNILPQPEDYLAFQALLEAQDRAAFYRIYPYAVQPATDDRPFFGHYFKWAQAPQLIAEIGKTWQPFGGAGYLVLLVLLIVSVVLSAVVILLPVLVLRHRRKSAAGQATARLPLRYPLYFGLLGLAFLLVEIPLIQSFILYLSNPAYAFSLVVFSLLAASGLGSLLGERLRPAVGLGLVVLYLLVAGTLRPALVEASLGWSLGGRMLLVCLTLAPLGLGMGSAFPGGIRWMSKRPGSQEWIPWMWAINGAASVISAVLAALLALTAGFELVLRLGMTCYLAAWLILMAAGRWSVAGSPAR